MKVQLEIPEGELGKSVVEILKGLDHHEKKELARQVMKEWLEKAVSVNERALREKDLVAEIRVKEDYYRNKSDADVRDGYRFKEVMRDWRSTHERMTEEVTKAVAEFYKKQVEDVVRQDPRVVALSHEVAQIVKEQLPKAVHDAQVAWFLQHMGGVLQGLGAAAAQLGNFDEFRRSMTERLSQIGQRVGITS